MIEHDLPDSIDMRDDGVIRNLKRRVDEAEAENARLRRELADARTTLKLTSTENETRLRREVDEMRAALDAGGLA